MGNQSVQAGAFSLALPAIVPLLIMPVPEHLPKGYWVLHSWVQVSFSPIQASGLLCCH